MLGKVEYASTLYFPINISTINIISYLRTKFEQNDAPCSKERNKHFCHFEKCDGHIITTNIRNVYISHLSSSYSYLTLPCQADRLQSAFFVIKIKSNHLAIERSRKKSLLWPSPFLRLKIAPKKVQVVMKDPKKAGSKNFFV